MPIARVQLPDGRIGKFEVPEGSSPQDVESFVTQQFSQQDTKQPEQPEMSRGEAAFTTLTNPLGLGARAKAGIAAGVAKTFGGEATSDIPFSELYGEQLGVEQGKLAQAREQYPVQSFATQMVSDVGPAIKTMKYAGKGLNAASKALGYTGKALKSVSPVKSAVAGGALISGISTVGEAEDLTDVPEVAEKLAFNVPMGALISGSIQSLASRIPQAISKRIYGDEAQDLVEKNITPDVAKQGLDIIDQAPVGSPTVGLDIDTPEFQSLVKTAVSKYPQAKRIAADFTAGRKDEALNRVGQALSKDVSPVDNAFKSIDDLILQRKEISGPIYTKAYESNILASKNVMNSLHRDSRLKPIMKKARKDYGLEAEVPDNSIQSLHLAREIVDDTIEAAKKIGENKKAHSYIKLRVGLDEALGEISPIFKQADEVFASKSKLINATKEGTDFSKIPYQELSKKIKDFTQGEREAFRVGARQAIMNIAEKATKETGKSAPAESIINKTYGRKQIKALFGGDDVKASQFVKKLDEEIRYDQTIKNLGLNKSEVDSSSKGLINLVARVAAFATTGSKPGLVFEGARAAETAILRQYQGLNKKNAQALVKAFTNKDKTKKILENIIKKADPSQKDILDDVITAIYPLLGSAVADEMGVSEAQAGDLSGVSSEQIRKDLGPVPDYLKDSVDLEQDLNKVKQRYYR